MVTLATIQRNGPHPTVHVSIWPCVAAALDIDGAPLSGVDMLGPPEGGRLQFGNVDEPAALLAYFFGHGGRQILLSFDGGTIEGWLETRWECSHWTWWLELDG